MSEDQLSYRQIVKATSLFGGVQFFKILISMIRVKFIAILLGPAGMGVVELLTSTTGLIEVITNFGLRTSAVRNVAAENAIGNLSRVSFVVKVLQRLVWITGLLGMFVTIVLAPWLSEMTFGNKDYSFAFVWISVSLLLTQISNGQQVILQGMRKLKQIAQANLIGSSLGLILTIPLYYWLGIRGIVPAIIITSVITLFATWMFSRKVKFETVLITIPKFIEEGKGMLTMGVMISFTGIFATLRFYIIRIFISSIGGIVHVGLYSAGISIINSYAGLIFDAMITDYLPRLSSVAHDNEKTSTLINQQATITVLFLGPLMAIFIVFSKFILNILFSAKFVEISLLIQWASLGMLFRAAAWSISWVFMAKNDASFFFKNEFLAGIVSFLLYILGYYLMGLTGIGVAFFVMYVYYTFQVYFFARKKYNFEFTHDFIFIFLIQQLVLTIIFLVAIFATSPLSYIPSTLLIFALSLYSFRLLDKKIGVLSFLSTIRKKSNF